MSVLTFIVTGGCVLVGASLAWSLISNVLALLLTLLQSIVSLVSFCFGIPRFMLSFIPGVGGLLEFLFTTVFYSVFRAHFVFVWDHLFMCVLGALLCVKFGFPLTKQAVTCYIVAYCVTFIYITISTLLPMILLAAVVCLAATAICHYFPLARPKFTGPFMCFVLSLMFHFFFDESPEHAWLMPLASTLSVLWIAGVLYFSPQSQRFIRFQIYRFVARNRILRNIALRVARFWDARELAGLLQRHALQRAHGGVGGAGAGGAGGAGAGGGGGGAGGADGGRGFMSLRRLRGGSSPSPPVHQRNSPSHANKLIVENGGDVLLPNGRKIHGVGENLECSICYCSLKQSTDGSAPAVKVLECSHVFHSQCIADWFQRDEHCPICRDRSSSLRNLRDFFFT